MSGLNESKPDNYPVNAKICRLVERYPCMYDRSHQYYLKKDVVDKAWIKISKEMDDSIPSCKERWRNIRTSFARSINVHKTPASANRTKPYYLHEELKFLARHITPGIPISRRSNNSYYSAGEESEEIKVSVSEESFDGFAAAACDDDDDEELDGDGGGCVDDASQGQKSSIAEDTASSSNSSEQIQQMQQIQQKQLEQQQLLKDIANPNLPETPVQTIITAAEVPPIMAPICPCPPKKRQRMFTTSAPTPTPSSDVHTTTATITPNDNDIKPNYTTNGNNVPDNGQSSATTQNATSMDFDGVFLQGLLPEMKAMDFHQKLIFKRRIYEVISELFDETPTNTVPMHNATSTTFQSQHQPITPAMTVINTADLNMIRRLNTLLQTTTTNVVTPNAFIALPKSVNNNNAARNNNAMRNNNNNNSAATATVALQQQRGGALTRASTNLLRVRMVNPPINLPIIPQPQQLNLQQQSVQVVKQEPDIVEE